MASTARFPDEVAIIDDSGTLTFREVHERSNALAHALAAEGIGVGDGVAIMCRNHRGFIEATIAASKLGANAIFLNTAFSGPQLADVARREDPRVVVYDEEFEEVLEEAAEGRLRVVAWHEPDGDRAVRTLDDIVLDGDRSDLKPPSSRGKAILLTSGTTGTPKGASRSQPRSLDPAATLLSRIPLRAREKTMIAAPLFHTWGFAHFTLGMSLSSTIVLRPPVRAGGDPLPHRAPRVLGARRGARDAAAAPRPRRRGAAPLRPVEAAGRARVGLGAAERARPPLDGPLRGEPLQPLRLDGDRLGDDRHAGGPAARARHRRQGAARHDRADLRRRMGSPSRPARRGRIFVGNEMQFEGYTGGGGKDLIDGLMSAGDVGHFDAEGRLFIDGRDDDMIVSGGENVFPGEVEDLLDGHEAIAEVTVFGVADEEFGERLAAVVVRRPGADLDAEDVRRLRQGQPRLLQGPARRRVRRRAAADGHREGAQTGAAASLVPVFGSPCGRRNRAYFRRRVLV